MAADGASSARKENSTVSHRTLTVRPTFALEGSRLIALGRVLFFSVALGGVYLDPNEPAFRPELAYTILILYLLWAVGLAFYLRHRLLLGRVAEMAISAIDIIVVAGRSACRCMPPQ